MDFVGHFLTQSPQTMHLLWSIRARLLSILIASTGQVLTQMPQAMQPTWHFFFTSTPLSLLWQLITTALDAWASSITCFGQAATHFPQAVHLSGLICGRLSALMVIASKGQARMQVPQPRHPYWQDLSPPAASTA